MRGLLNQSTRKEVRAEGKGGRKPPARGGNAYGGPDYIERNFLQKVSLKLSSKTLREALINF
jgi:hypothetical protein